MAKRRNKAAKIRAALAENPDASAREVVETLAAQRVRVTAAQVELAESIVDVDYAAAAPRRRELIERLSTRATVRFLPNYTPTFSAAFPPRPAVRAWARLSPSR